MDLNSNENYKNDLKLTMLTVCGPANCQHSVNKIWDCNVQVQNAIGEKKITR